MKKTHIIIGTSAAAIGCITTLRKLDSDATIICISQEHEDPYNKCFLVDVWSGQKTEAQIKTKPRSFFEEHCIDLILGVSVTAIDSDAKCVKLDDGRSLKFDTLLIATGSRPRQFSHAQTSQPNLFYFHTLDDTNRLMAFIKKHSPQNAVVIGSGFTGLEVADVLNQKGINTTVIERGSRVLARFCSEAESEIIQQAMRRQGVEFMPGEEVIEIYKGPSIQSITGSLGMNINNNSSEMQRNFSLSSNYEKQKNANPTTSSRVDDEALATSFVSRDHIILKSGKIIQADLIIVAIGVIPNGEIAHEAGIAMHNGSIATNDNMQTSIPAIFAAGDVVLVKDQLTGEYVPSCMWADAMQQGMVAASNMAGIKKEYPGVITTGTSHFFGLDIMMSGDHTASGKQTVYKTDESYRRFTLQEDRLKAFVIIGKMEKVGKARRALMMQATITSDELA
jgi:NAD(P)H-nitrite reductase large subunit